ncbi:MAG: exodeoxyribonuclease VII large subunit [Tepidisphaerales bacterium]
MTGFFDLCASLGRGGGGTARPQGSADPATPLTVSELTRQIKSALKEAFPRPVAVRGEVSNCRAPNQSGHLYFSLKDAGAVLPAVMFSNSVRGLTFELRDGLEVVATGRLDVYEEGGRYNFVVSSVVPLGTGALQLAYRQLYEKLAAEGLFDPARKRPIPKYPRTLALVTSRSAAGLQDMLKVLRRFPFLRVIVVPVPVQGEGAAERIARAIEGVNEHAASLGGVDVLLLGRGGGSFEDLFEFSREVVARAVAASRIPVVTGIGHEIDVAIADLVADHHAHTPTEAATYVTRHWAAAAEFCDEAEDRLAARVRRHVMEARRRLRRVEESSVFAQPDMLLQRRHLRLDDRDNRLRLALSSRLQAVRRRVETLERRLTACDPRGRLERQRRSLTDAEHRLHRLLAERMRRLELRWATLRTRLDAQHPAGRLRQLSERLNGAARQLRVLGPESVLARGYSITQREDGRIVRSAGEVHPGDRLRTTVADGQIDSRVE